ncbi:hypothetical protein AcV7_003573 [Taiwanofungus camphoratus]|nr:hypothetical protein AcV7_003573 [Antrodia cinnamomea]
MTQLGCVADISCTLRTVTPRTPSPRRIATSPTPSPSKVRVTYLSRTPSRSHESFEVPATPSPKPLVRSDTLPVVSSTNSPASPSPKKPAKDLSDLFDFSRSSKGSGTGVILPKAPASVAKRMLRRSHTESSMNGASGSSSFESIDDPSRSNQLASPKLAKVPSESVIDLTNDLSSSRSHSISPPKPQSLDDVSSPPVSTSARPSLTANNVRTYAGKSRSFLVALPTAQLEGLSRSNSQSLLVDEDDLHVNSQADDFEIRESYTDLRTRWGVDNSEDDPRPPSPVTASPGEKSKQKGKGKQAEALPVVLPNGMLNDLKSITELRSKGETRRFLDEVGYLFEGMDAKGAVSVRRGRCDACMPVAYLLVIETYLLYCTICVCSALGMVTKVCDPDFARKAKAADFWGRAWDVLREAGAGAGDKVLDTVLVFFAALVARDPRDLTDLATRSDFASNLYHMLASLERENDPLWLISCTLSDAELRRAGIPKVEKTLLTNLQRLIRKKSGLLEDGDIISNRLLISLTLTALPPPFHKHQHISSLLTSFTLELGPLSSRLSAYTSGLSLLPSLSSASSLDSISFSHVDNCLRLLDSFLLGCWADAEAEELPDSRRLNAEREEGLGDALMALCTACGVISRDTQYQKQSPTANRCIESVLRVLINLTHDDLEWCQAVLGEQSSLLVIMRLIVISHRQRAIKCEDEDELQATDIGDGVASSLDRMCLALGVLTNLVQVSHEAKERTRETLIDFDCKGRRACIRACCCPSRISALECLALVYLQRCTSDNELDLVIRGHMAILFGLLMRGCPDNQLVLLGALPGSSDKRKLNTLIEHARDFTQFYVEFTKKVSAVVNSQSRGDDEDYGMEARTLGVNIDGSMERVLRDANGETVAREVISFLEGLRDNGP